MIVRTPERLMIANDLAKDAAATFRSLPDFVSLSGCGIRDTDGPGLARAPGFREVFFLCIWNADESDLAAVRRPHGISVMIGAGIEIVEGVGGKRIDADEAMTPAVADEGKLVAIR